MSVRCSLHSDTVQEVDQHITVRLVYSNINKCLVRLVAINHGSEGRQNVYLSLIIPLKHY